MPNEEVLKLAYEAVIEMLKQQDSTLGNLRTRATGLLGAAAIGTSFAASVGLYKAEPNDPNVLPPWAGWSLLALTVVIGGTVMFALWPITDWSFGPDPTRLLESSNKDLKAFYSEAVTGLAVDAKANSAAIERRFRAYRIGVAALILQIVALVLGILLIPRP